MRNENIYEVEYEPLINEDEIEELDCKDSILESEIEVSVEIGNFKKNIQDILSFKEDEIILIDGAIEEVSICINKKKIARGEYITVGDKLAVRVMGLI